MNCPVFVSGNKQFIERMLCSLNVLAIVPASMILFFFCIFIHESLFVEFRAKHIIFEYWLKIFTIDKFFLVGVETYTESLSLELLLQAGRYMFYRNGNMLPHSARVLHWLALEIVYKLVEICSNGTLICYSTLLKC